MQTKTQEKSLRNEETPKMPSLPSGTFSKDGLPTIVTELVANHVVRLQENGMDPMQHLKQIVEDLDAHLLLPTNPGLTQDIKEKRVRWAVRLMVEEKETILTRSATIYSACQIALRRAKSQLKIARSSSI
jgi:hypothetical protein